MGTTNREPQMGTPVVHPYPGLQEDCRELRSALRGLLCNEKKVIDILGRRTQKQRDSITEAYKTLYDESLHKRIKACFSGKLEKCLLLWTMDPSDRDAVLLYEALREGGPKKDRIVIGMLCTRTPGQIYLIKQAYYTLFNQTLESHLDGSGYFVFGSHNKSKWAFWKSSEPKVIAPPKRVLAITKLLLALARGKRPETRTVDKHIALTDAHQLNKVCSGKLGNEENLIRIFSTRSSHQLTATMNFYHQHYGHEFDKALSKKETSEFLQALRVAVKSLRQPSKFYGEELCIALQGSPIDEDTTIHILSSRAEVDLPLVKSEFKSESNRALEDVLTSSTDTLPTLLRHFFLTIIAFKETPGFTPRTSDGSGKSYYMSPRSTASHQISNGSQNDSYHSGSIGSSGSSSFQEL